MAYKKFDTLTTPEYESYGASGWDSVYPRPNMKRESFLSLNGIWDFTISKEDAIPSAFDKKIRVPFPPESLLSGLEMSIGKRDYMVYSRTFTLPNDFMKSSLIIHFGAVDQMCRVYINGKAVGSHEGGYIPFSFDITDFITEGENTVTVIAKDSVDRKYPYGKQKIKRGGMWYTPVSGIWQSVWLESLPENHIEEISVTSYMDRAEIKVAGPLGKKTLTFADGETYTFEGENFVYKPENPHTWSPSDPYLYEFTLSTDTDIVESYFALREIEILDIRGKKRTFLNKKPIFISSLLDQGYYPDGIFLPASPYGYERDITLAKELGFNALRKHIKIEPMVFYYLCDKLGMIVLQDMVNNSSYSFFLDTALPTLGFKKARGSLRHRNPEERKIFLDAMEKTAKLLHSSPSVLVYTIFNEGWGQFEPDAVYDRLKALEPTRLIDATSGWFYSKKSDFNSMHIYFKAPLIEKENGKAIFLSEFGGFSYRCDGHLFGERNYGYSLFRTEEAFTDAVIKLFEEDTLPLIDDGLCMTVYTQLSDVEDETNGLITYNRRRLKLDAEKMKAANEALYKRYTDAVNHKD